MPLSPSERMAAFRARQKEAGRVTLSLLVPEEDVAFFTELAAQRRHRADQPAAAPVALEPTVTPRAEKLAQRLLQGMAAQGWPAGRPLGSEAELMNSHGVSRAVLRQTIRLLEHQGVASMRRGAGGGLVIRQPDLSATLQAASVYLQSRGIAPIEVLQTRKILELATVELAIARLDAVGEAKLLKAMEADEPLNARSDPSDLQRLHETIGGLAGDPALLLFLQVVLRLTQAQFGFAGRAAGERERVVARIKRIHRAIAEAVLARDLPAAQQLVAKYLDAFPSWMGEQRPE